MDMHTSVLSQKEQKKEKLYASQGSRQFIMNTQRNEWNQTRHLDNALKTDK